MRVVRAFSEMVRGWWRVSPPLMAVVIAMVALVALDAMAMTVDRRLITGDPAWWKPAKFALSTALYAASFAWLITWLPERPRLRRRTGWATAIGLMVEIVIIHLQAWRGTSSHFNFRACPISSFSV